MAKRLKFGFKLNDAKADTNAINTEFTQLLATNGKLTPEIIVTAATPEDSPLHDLFEWDDALAGHEWRLHQARLLICSIQTVEKQPAWVHVQVTDKAAGTVQGVYVPLAEALADQDMRKQVLANAKRDLAAFKRRYEGYVEMSKYLTGIEETLTAIEEDLEEVTD